MKKSDEKIELLYSDLRKAGNCIKSEKLESVDEIKGLYNDSGKCKEKDNTIVTNP